LQVTSRKSLVDIDIDIAHGISHIACAVVRVREAVGRGARGGWGWGREPRAESREPRAESREPRAAQRQRPPPATSGQ
jgi:hypothetical protein